MLQKGQIQGENKQICKKYSANIFVSLNQIIKCYQMLIKQQFEYKCLFEAQTIWIFEFSNIHTHPWLKL